MGLVTWGIDEQAVRKTVYYEGTNTIYEGMPVCYNFDTTDNWTGASVASGVATETGTTAEGYHNEGKFIRVEDVSATNGNAFAGVVAMGQNVGKAGPKTVDIYVPNGAIVPVRTNLSTTVGVTPLAINTSEQSLTSPHSAGQIVAIAWETVDRSSTAGLCLAKLDSNLTLQGRMGSSALNVTAADATSTMILNNVTVTEAQTAGSFVPLFIHHTSTGDTSAAFYPYNILAYMNLNGTYDQTCYMRTILAQTNLGGTLNGSNLHICSVMAQLSGAGTQTQVSKLACLMCDTSITGAGPTTGDLSFVRCANNSGQYANVKYVMHIYGGYGVENLFNLDGCANTGEDTSYMVFAGGTGSSTITTGGAWKKIRIVIDSTDYYLVALPAPADS